MKTAERVAAAEAAGRVMRSVLAAAHDPASVRWTRARAPADGRLACVEYTGTNAYGARVQGFAVMAPGGKISASPVAWNDHCLAPLPIVTSTAARLDGR